MSILNSGGEVSELSSKECKRDIDREIRNARARADSFTRMVDKLADVADDQFFYSMSDNETRRSLASLIGAGTMEAKRWSNAVNRLIEELELEQEK